MRLRGHTERLTAAMLITAGVEPDEKVQGAPKCALIIAGWHASDDRLRTLLKTYTVSSDQSAQGFAPPLTSIPRW